MPRLAEEKNMTEILTIVGKVATDPTTGRTAGGTPVTNFRLASTHRRFDQATNTWIDAETNWFSVAAFRQLAEHVRASLHTGDSVIVTGRLKIRNWEANGKHGTSVDIDAEAIGHDLRWGTSSYMPRSRVITASREFGDADGSPTRGDVAAAPAHPGQLYPDPVTGEVSDDEENLLDDIDVSWATSDEEVKDETTVLN